jgi:TRAP-type C4-dicarboxylate transport system permease small subunit
VVLFLRRVSDWTDWLARGLLVPIGTAFILVVFLGVLTRYVFRAPIITSVELARIGFVWSVFLGAAICLKKEKHTQFLFLLDRLRGTLRGVVKVAISFLSVGFFSLLTVNGVLLVQAVQETYFPALGWSQVCLYLPVPVCSAFMLVHSIAFLFRDIQGMIWTKEGEIIR